MGACCGPTVQADPEIEQAKSLKEIIEILKKRANKMPEEKKDIETYLQDKSKEIEAISVKGISDDNLRERLPFLDVLQGKYLDTAKILNQYPELPLNDTKSLLYDITKCYFMCYDPNGELQKAFGNFKRFVNSVTTKH